jgi:hypothetical protein
MKYLLSICLIFFVLKTGELPVGWMQIEKTKIGREKIEVYFFDYMSRLGELQPDYLQHKGREFTDILQKVQFQFPAYVAKRKVGKEDSVIYFILRPNEAKSNGPNIFDLEIVKVNEDFPLQSLEDKMAYKDRILKITDAPGCWGSLVNEYNKIIQDSPNKEKLIGNGVQITDSIFTRVIPYKELKRFFFKLIETNL